MKSTFLKTVHGESSVEVDVSAERFIENLRQLNGDCRSTDTDGCELMFRCSKDGRFRLMSSSFSKNCILGRVEAENGKTVVRFYDVYDHRMAVVRWALLAMNIVWMIIYFKLDFTYFLILLLDAILCFGVLFSLSIVEKRNMTIDFPVMKEELLRKIDAAEKWDE